MNPDDPSTWFTGNPWQMLGTAMGMLATGGTLGALWLRRKLASDATAIANDRAEVDIIATLQKDNEQLRASLRESNLEREKLWKEMADMSATMKIMEFQLSSIQKELQALREEKGQTP